MTRECVCGPEVERVTLAGVIPLGDRVGGGGGPLQGDPLAAVLAVLAVAALVIRALADARRSRRLGGGA